MMTRARAKMLRSRLRMSQTAFAHAAGVSLRTIGNWENKPGFISEVAQRRLELLSRKARRTTVRRRKPKKNGNTRLPLKRKMKGREVQALRKRLRMTQEQFASAISRTSSAVSRWEMGLSSPSKESSKQLKILARRTRPVSKRSSLWTSRCIVLLEHRSTLKPKQFARALGIHPHTLTSWKSGRQSVSALSAAALTELARTLRVKRAAFKQTASTSRAISDAWRRDGSRRRHSSGRAAKHAVSQSCSK